MTHERHEIKAQLDRARAQASAAKKSFEQFRNRKADLATFELAKQRNATLETDRTELLEAFDRLKGALHGQTKALVMKLTDLTDALTARDRAAEVVRANFEASLAQLQGAQAKLSQQLHRAAADTEGRMEQKIHDQAAQIAQLTQDQRTQRDRIDTLQTEKVGLLEQIMTEKVKYARLEEDSAVQTKQLKQEMAALEKRLSAARARLTPKEGGEADLKTVRARSAALANAYNAMYAEKTAHVPADPSVLTELNRFSDDLFAEQSLLARLVEAQGLYTVRPRDSLSRIAYRVYGSADRWQDIFKTNQHLLHDPNELVPGLVLVIP